MLCRLIKIIYKIPCFSKNFNYTTYTYGIGIFNFKLSYKCKQLLK